MPFNVANMLTVLRLILAPIFVTCFIAGWKETAFVIFCVAAFTDLIDGTVARLLGQPSKYGAILDPIADKLLMQSSFIALAVTKILPLWFLALALLRDIMIVSGIIWLEWIEAKLPYQPTVVSKLATLLQLAVAVLGLIIWWQTGGRVAGDSVGELYFYATIIAAILIVISGVLYVNIGLGILRSAKCKIQKSSPNKI